MGFSEAILPAVWLERTFAGKISEPELLGQMWRFTDRGGRACCLIPEATAVFQEMCRVGELRGETRLFYVSRCWRYERPQAGRQREFTQLGVEILNPSAGSLSALSEARAVCADILPALAPRAPFEWNDSARRGLGYYLGGEGFEASCPLLGAQRQVAGGGAYAEGAGFALGLERVLLAAGLSAGL